MLDLIFRILLVSISFFSLHVLAGEGKLERSWRKLYYLDLQSGQSFYFTDDPGNVSSEIQKARELFSSKEKWDTDLHTQCLFPARFKLLKNYFPEEFSISRCPAFDKWISTLSPQGVSLIFAGNYPDNPGSIFGHTFLKVKTNSGSRLQSGGSQRSEILDYALNYAARVDEDPGFLYAMKGLFGQYRGFYSMDPYYIKVNEYSEGEGRDLWEYELNISPQESHFLLAHFWEIRYQSAFSYYFLDDNCSYLILKLLDATKPEWNLIDKHPSYVIPIETVKQVKSIPGAIKSANYRSSIRRRAEKSYNDLNPFQKSKVLSLLNSMLAPASIGDASVLNTVILKSFSNKSRNDGVLSSNEEKILEVSIKQLSLLDTSKVQLVHDAPGDPSDSHGVKQIGVGLGEQHTGYSQFHFRPGLHDLTDFPRGYLDFSELVIMDTRIRVQDDKVTLNHVEFFDLGLLRPSTMSERSYSWRTRWSYQNQSQNFCKLCSAIYGEAGLGAANFLFPHSLVYILAGPFLNASALKGDQIKAGGFSELGLISRLGENFRLITSFASFLNMANVIDGRTLHKGSLQGTYNYTKDVDLNLALYFNMKLNGSEEYQRSSVATVDYHF